MDNKIIGQRINAALALRDVKQKELATGIGLSQDNTVSYWCNGKRKPNIEQIIQIAKFLNVSSDFLLGLSDVPTNDIQLKSVCDYTGLSEEAVKSLNSHHHLYKSAKYRQYRDSIMKFFSYFVLSGDKIFCSIYPYICSVTNCKRIKKQYPDIKFIESRIIPETNSEKFIYKLYFDRETKERQDLYLFQCQRKISNSIMFFLRDYSNDWINANDSSVLDEEFFKACYDSVNEFKSKENERLKIIKMCKNPKQALEAFMLEVYERNLKTKHKSVEIQKILIDCANNFIERMQEYDNKHKLQEREENGEHTGKTE